MLLRKIDFDIYFELFTNRSSLKLIARLYQQSSQDTYFHINRDTITRFPSAKGVKPR